MAVNEAVTIPAERLAEFCRKWKITELALFGSSVRADFHADSDVDVLVTFAPDARWGLFDLVRLDDELSELFGRTVDVSERGAVERSENYIRRKRILESAQTIYAAAR